MVISYQIVLELLKIVRYELFTYFINIYIYQLTDCQKVCSLSSGCEYYDYNLLDNKCHGKQSSGWEMLRHEDHVSGSADGSIVWEGYRLDAGDAGCFDL